MHIENVEALTAWLKHAVNPLCDADPQVLAQYIIALVKKHETTESLVSGCNKNLELFFTSKTSAFVSELVEMVTSNVYVTWYEERRSAGGAPVADNPSIPLDLVRPQGTALPRGKSKTSHDPWAGSSPVKSSPATRDDQNEASVRRSDFIPESHGRSLEGHKTEPDDRLRSQREKSDQLRRMDRDNWKHPSPFPGHSNATVIRNHQQDRTKRHHSLEKGASRSTTDGATKRPSPFRSTESERNVGSHQPSGRGWQSRHTRHDPSSGRTTLRPSPSPASQGSFQRRSRVDEHASSSLERTGHLRKRSRSSARSTSRSPSARSDSSRSSSESFSSKCSASKRIHVEREPVDSRSSTPLEENANRTIDTISTVPRDVERPNFQQKCRDYDEMGYCIQGKTCPFDHGNDPVVIESPRLPTLMPYQGMPVPGLMDPAQVHRTIMGSLPDPLVLPNVSRPPPPNPFRPPTLPPAHFLPPHALPPLPPTFFRPPPLAVCSGPPPQSHHKDLYMQQPDAYLTEPYEPMPRGTIPPAVETPGSAWLSRDTHLSYPSQPRSAAITVVSRHANLVRVPTQEGVPQDKTESVAASAGQSGLKRKASMMDEQASHPDAAGIPPPVKKPAPEHPGVRHGVNQASNTTLELRKIPRDQNTIANINDHFSKFGIIVNLQVGWEGDPQAALVSYASSAQAAAAYRSQEPFLNNRFIKIFWHNADKTQQQQQMPQQQQQGRLVAPVAATEVQTRPKRHVFPERHKLQLNNTLKKAALPTSKPEVATVPVVASKDPGPETTQAPPVPVSEPQSTREVSLTKIQRKPIKDVDEKTEVLKKKAELEQQSRQLLTKYLDQQKVLFEKLEKDKATLTTEDRADIVQTIKKLAANIETLQAAILKMSKKAEPVAKSVVRPTVARGSLKKVNVRHQSRSSSRKETPHISSDYGVTPGSIFQDRQQAQKAILDTELELMTDSADAEELRKRVLTLKAEAASLGLLGSGYGRGGVIRGRGRGGPGAGRRWSVPRYRSNPLTVDRRPKQLLITGFQLEEKEELLAHISSFGALESSSFDLSVPSLHVSFKLRMTAEKVAADGCDFNDKKLAMVWQKSVLSELNTGSDQPDSGVATKPATHSSFRSNATSENNVPDTNKPSHVTLKKSEEDEEEELSLETDVKSLCDSKLQNQESINEEDDNVLCLDEEDDDDDEEERPWRR